MSALSKHGFERTHAYDGRCEGCGKLLAGKSTYVHIIGSKADKHLCYGCFQKWTQRKSEEIREAAKCMSPLYIRGITR